MTTLSTGKTNFNFPGLGDDPNFARSALGDNWDRLVDVKRECDPTNLFRLNQNIDPNTATWTPRTARRPTATQRHIEPSPDRSPATSTSAKSPALTWPVSSRSPLHRDAPHIKLPAPLTTSSKRRRGA